MATVLHTAATLLALISVVHIFGADFNLRAQQPSARSVGMMWACTAATLVTLPLATGLTWADLYHLLWALDTKPIAFLPRGILLYAHKVVTSLGALALAMYAMNEFNLAKQRPLAPVLSTFVGSNIWRRIRWASEQTTASPSAFGGRTETEPQNHNSRRTITPPISPRSMHAAPSRWPTPPRAVMADKTHWNTPSREMNEMPAGGMHQGFDVLS